MKNHASLARVLALLALVAVSGCFNDWRRGVPAEDGGDAAESTGSSFDAAVRDGQDSAADTVGDRPDVVGAEVLGDSALDASADAPLGDAPADGEDAPLDAPAFDTGGPDGCACDESKNPCAETVCVKGQCEPRPKANNTKCDRGLCWDGACCEGCIDKGQCISATGTSACGIGGVACVRCNDGNPCTEDRCINGQCDDKTRLSKVDCTDGVCVEGVCSCGGPGQPCCAGTTDCKDGLKCLGGTCGECGAAGKPCCPGTTACFGSTTCVGGAAGVAAGTCKECGDVSEQCCEGQTCNTGACDKTSNTCKECGDTDQLCCKGGDECKNAGLVCTSEGKCRRCGGQGEVCCAKGSCTSDHNECNGEERCEGGTCGRTPAVTCNPPEECQARVFCEPTTGACIPVPKTNGTPCDDRNKCSMTSTCQGGACSGSDWVVCTTSNQCENPGACVPETGACAPPKAKDDGASCDDKDLCTSSDKCSAGQCAGTRTCPPPVCTPTMRRCMDLTTQVCSYAGQWVSEATCPYACSAGMCTKKASGALCQTGDECLTGNCVDGRCCGQATCGTCESCTGANGTCSKAVRNAEDADSCKDLQKCDANANCIDRFAEYPVNHDFTNVARGPDGRVWLSGGTNWLGHIDVDGTNLKEFQANAQNLKVNPRGMTAGPDNMMWLAESNSRVVGRIDPATDAITEFRITGFGPYKIVVGPDKALWFTVAVTGQIGRITVDGATLNEYPASAPEAQPWDITAGPDDALWFVEIKSNKVGRIATDGKATWFDLPNPDSGPQSIASGPDGALWISEFHGNRIGRMSVDGKVTNEYSTGGYSYPLGIIRGPDGALWFTEQQKNTLTQITTAGVIRRFAIPTPNALPLYVCVGPDGNIWVAEPGALKVARFIP